MPITPDQKTAMDQVLAAILAATAPRGKRQLSAMFLELVDREDWPQYYEVIPEPRCLNNVKAGLDKGRYKEATDVYTDISLVFWNALYYNEPGSGIASDAETLKTLLETEWKKRSVLPIPRTSPPPSSAQKVHKGKGIAEEDEEEEPPKPAQVIPPAPSPASVPIAAPTPKPATRVITHAPVHNLAPTASTSTANYSYAKPVTIRTRLTQHQDTPDMDVDVVSPVAEVHGDEGAGVGMERDPQSEEIVKQLERGLPRWPGFADVGWAEGTQERILEIAHAIKSHKDVIGNRLATALESVPEETSSPHLPFTAPLSLKLIESRARSKSYANAKEFDMDMARLFLKARRWHNPCTEPYGQVLLLQRLYQALTSPNPPPQGTVLSSSTNFASLRAGPGNVKPVHGASDSDTAPSVTSYRVPTKDRVFVDEVTYKGWSVKLADWLHLANPDDPSRPIIGQVFRCWVSDDSSKKGQPGVTVSWYYRPEQTFHSPTRQFWEGEVFKTSHFADHPVEDIIEKIACQFTARHIRGRPRPPYWYPGFPLYVCDSRYNDRDRAFVKIKNWNSCVPEEVRKSTEFMPIYPFEKTVYPVVLASPFLAQNKSVSKCPGGIVRTESQAAGVNGNDPEVRTTRSMQASQSSHVQQQQAPGYVQQQQVQRPSGPDRSIITAAGGLAALGGGAHVEKLPPETVKHFDRDPETGEMLWFPAPPLNVTRPRGPRYSLAYLNFVATKRKRQEEGSVEDEGAGAERSRSRVRPTVSENMRAALKDMGLP